MHNLDSWVPARYHDLDEEEISECIDSLTTEYDRKIATVLFAHGKSHTDLEDKYNIHHRDFSKEVTDDVVNRVFTAKSIREASVDIVTKDLETRKTELETKIKKFKAKISKQRNIPSYIAADRQDDLEAMQYRLEGLIKLQVFSFLIYTRKNVIPGDPPKK